MAYAGACAGAGIGGLLQFLLDVPGQDLAQLHAPLVEAVDIPDHALYQGLVFVQGDQGAQGGRGQGGQQQGIAGAVAGELTVRRQQACAFRFQPLSLQGGRTCARLLPTIKASDWAKQFASNAA